jgi:putative transposase
MTAKVKASEIKTKQLSELLGTEGITAFKDLVKVGMEKILQEALEGEVTEFLGREWYERQSGEESKRGYRNGYYDRQVKTTEGKINLRSPRVRESSEEFESQILERLEALEENLKRLSLEMYVRGLSTRDIEETFIDAEGKKLLSKSTVSKLNEKLQKEYEEFSQRDLSMFDVVYLFIDGVYEGVRHYTNNQALLCSWGILSDGTKQLISIMTVQSESQSAWEVFFEDMLCRGLRQPLLVIADGSKGAKQAIIRSFPKAHRQRCIAHKMRNLSVKLPKDKEKEVIKEVKAIYYANDYDEAKQLSGNLINKYINQYPSMIKSFNEDIEACLTHFKFPEEHRHFIRTTNLIERAFVEEKRRTKVFPQHQSEKALTGLVYAVLWRASKKWYRIPMSETDLVILKNIRKLIAPKDIESKLVSYELAA